MEGAPGYFLLLIYSEMWSGAQSLRSLCGPVECSSPGSSVHGIFQARNTGGGWIPTPGDLPDPGIKPVSLVSPALAGGLFTPAPPGKPSVVWRWADGELEAAAVTRHLRFTCGGSELFFFCFIGISSELAVI